MSEANTSVSEANAPVSEPAASPSGPAPGGRIHDLGYKRYAGVRQSTSTRWLVIARNQIATSWKTWWRFKLSLGLAVIITAVAGGVMFLLSDRTATGLALPSGIAATLTDAALPRAIEWYSRAAFLFSLATGAGVIARDVQSGAFTFYFARSVRPRDYVLGKLGGMLALNAVLMLAGPLALAIARLALSESTDQLLDLLPVVPKTLALGLLGTLAFAAVPLGFSTLVRNPRYAMALWAVYYLAVGFMMIVLSRELKNGLAALDIPTALDALTYDLFHMAQSWGRSKRVDPSLALVSLLAHAAAAIALVAYKVRRAHLAGIGGSS